MSIDKIVIKFFADELGFSDQDFINLFQSWIREGRLEGLLLDVADYSHVPNGPSVLLVGNEADYCIDRCEGPVGLLYNRKRLLSGDDQQRVGQALAAAVAAAQALEADSGRMVTFGTGRLLVIFNDRLAHPNSDAGFAAVQEPLQQALNAVFGEVELARDTTDSRHRLTVNVTVPSVPKLADLAVATA